MKGWVAVLSALLVLPIPAQAADDLAGAARELARKTVAFVGRGESVSLNWRNLSSLGASDLTQARGVFEGALRDAGVRPVDTGGIAEIRITLSESQSQYLLVGEARKGDDRQTLMAWWKRALGSEVPAVGISLERRLLWEQADPILDVAVTPTGLLVLSPSKLSMYAGREERGSVAIVPAKPLPRDPRGRLSINGTEIQVYLPGTACTGSMAPTPTLECRPSEDPWPLEWGAKATFATGRNYFDGRVVSPNGSRKNLPPFFTVAPVDERGRTYWTMALTDGRTQILDGNFDVVGSVGGWGSDLASARCGNGSQILTTKPGDAQDGDSLRAYAMANRAMTPLTAAMDFGGPVTALWSAGGPSVIVVSRDAGTGRYAAYLVTVVCGG